MTQSGVLLKPKTDKHVAHFWRTNCRFSFFRKLRIVAGAKSCPDGPLGDLVITTSDVERPSRSERRNEGNRAESAHHRRRSGRARHLWQKDLQSNVSQCKV